MQDHAHFFGDNSLKNMFVYSVKLVSNINALNLGILSIHILFITQLVGLLEFVLYQDLSLNFIYEHILIYEHEHVYPKASSQPEMAIPFISIICNIARILKQTDSFLQLDYQFMNYSLFHSSLNRA